MTHLITHTFTPYIERIMKGFTSGSFLIVSILFYLAEYDAAHISNNITIVCHEVSKFMDASPPMIWRGYYLSLLCRWSEWLRYYHVMENFLEIHLLALEFSTPPISFINEIISLIEKDIVTSYCIE